MTREEIISGLKFTIEMCLFDPSTGKTYTEPRNDMDKTTIDACKGAIELLEQETRTGYWIKHEHNGIERIECSECSSWFLKAHLIRNSYCPNCRAKMIKIIESQGSEVV